MYEDSGSLPIMYRGASVGEYSHLARNDISTLLVDISQRSRQLLFAVVAELVRNAEKYGNRGGRPSELMVDRDKLGTFVEVVSYGDRGDAFALRRIIEAHRHDTDDQLVEEELATMDRNQESNKSGIGILQVLRRSKMFEGERLVKLKIDEQEDIARVKIRVHVG